MSGNDTYAETLRERCERIFNIDACVRLARSTPEYYDSHGHYLPDVAWLLNETRADLGRERERAGQVEAALANSQRREGLQRDQFYKLMNAIRRGEVPRIIETLVMDGLSIYEHDTRAALRAGGDVSADLLGSGRVLDRDDLIRAVGELCQAAREADDDLTTVYGLVQEQEEGIPVISATDGPGSLLLATLPWLVEKLDHLERELRS